MSIYYSTFVSFQTNASCFFPSVCVSRNKFHQKSTNMVPVDLNSALKGKVFENDNL